MSKPNLSFRVPENYADEVEDFMEREGLDDRSEAARQVLRRGIEHSRRESGGEQLARIGTSVALVGEIVAASAALLGQPWGATVVVPFGIATFVFALLWAAVRALERGEVL